MPKRGGQQGAKLRGGARGKDTIRRASTPGSGSGSVREVKREPRPLRGQVELTEAIAKHRAHRRLQAAKATAITTKSVPIYGGSFFNLWTANTGKKWVGQANKFRPPSQATQNNAQALMHAINAFEADSTAANFAQIQTLASQLHLIMWRIPEDPSVVVFVPNQQDTPIVTGAALAWRIGDMANPAMVVSPHEGQDGTQWLETSFFINCAPFVKFLLGNAFNRNIVVKPHVKKPYRHNNVGYPADMDHSDLTIGPSFQGPFGALYPTGVGFVMHGHYMKNTQAIIGNGYGKVPQDQPEPFYLLFQIALAFEFNRLGFKAVFTSVQDFGYVIENGYLTPVASSSDPNAYAHVHTGSIDNMGVGIHVMGGATANVFAQEKSRNAGKFVFSEASPDHMRAGNAPLVMAYINAANTAAAWLDVYDPAIHRPWSTTFQQNFPGVYYDMNNYASLFDPDNIAAIKAAMRSNNVINKAELPDSLQYLTVQPPFKRRTPAPSLHAGETASPTPHVPKHTLAPVPTRGTLAPHAPTITKTPAPVRAPTTGKTSSPVRAPTTGKTSSPVRAPTTGKTSSPVRAPTTGKTSSPVRAPTAVHTTKQPVPAPTHSEKTTSPTGVPTAPKRHEYEAEYEAEYEYEEEQPQPEYEYERVAKPTPIPSDAPTWSSPTHLPTKRPSVAKSPTRLPTKRPSVATESPTHLPTKRPSVATESPTRATGSPVQSGWITMQVTASQCAVFQLTPEIQSGAKPFTLLDGDYQLYVNGDGIYWLDSNGNIMSQSKMFTTPLNMHTVSSIQMSSTGIGVYVNGVLQYSAPIPAGALNAGRAMTLFMDSAVMKAQEVSVDQCARRMLSDMVQADATDLDAAEPLAASDPISAQAHTGTGYFPGFAALHDAPHPRLRGAAAQYTAPSSQDTEFTMPAPTTGQSLSAALLVFVVGAAVVHRRATQTALTRAREVEHKSEAEQKPEVPKDKPVATVAVMPARIVRELNMMRDIECMHAPRTLHQLHIVLLRICEQADEAEDIREMDVSNIQEAGVLVASLIRASDALTEDQIERLHAIISKFDARSQAIQHKIVDPTHHLYRRIANLQTVLNYLYNATRPTPGM